MLARVGLMWLGTDAGGGGDRRWVLIVTAFGGVQSVEFVALGERMGNFIGSVVFWDHDCGAREEGEDVAVAFICRPPMGTPKPRGWAASRSQSS